MKTPIATILINLSLTALVAQAKDGPAPYRALTAAEANKFLEENPNAVLLDVRTPEEHSQLRIPGSVLIPDYELAARMAEELPDKNAPIVLYCRSGNRSRTAAMRLLKAGYTRVYDAGGINAWPYKTESGPVKKQK